MLRKNKNKEKPRHIVNIIPGGGRFMWFSAALNAEIERITGHYMRDLCTGGFVGSSGGSFIAASCAINDPNDPSKPLFAMTDFEDICFEQLPHYLENKPHLYVNHIIRLVARMEQEGMLSIPRTNISKPFSIVQGMGTKVLINKLIDYMKAHNMIGEKQEDRIKEVLSQNLPYDKIPIHLDRSYMESHLKTILSYKDNNGNEKPFTMDDIGRSLCITTQEIFPKARAYDFFKLTPEILKKSPTMLQDNPHRHIPIYKMVLASAAMPTVFASYHIAEIGASFSDSADIDTGIDNVLRLKEQAIHEDFDVGILYSGNTKGKTPIPPLAFDNHTFIDQMLLQDRYILQRTPIQTRSRMRSLANIFLGEANVRVHEILTKDSEGNQIVPFSLDVTCTTEEQMSLMREFWEEDYKKRPEFREQINLTCEFLMQNKQKIESHKIGKTIFTPPPKPNSP
jgi:hypothetical protein